VAGQLILIAASGLALEAAEAARARGLTVRGCLDDNEALWGRDAGGWLPVLGGLDLVAAFPDDSVVICAGKGSARAHIAQRLSAGGLAPERYATLVHPSVTVPTSCCVGPGSVILAGCVLTASVSLGSHVVVMPQVTLTHDNRVEDYATLCAAVTLGGYVSVAQGAYLGMAACVRERVRIGAHSTLGMGSVLLSDLPADEVWVGVPARPLARASAPTPGRD
jgi:sugar O-acyltransferase (sialic acid O-acetyltransferase NeuD family)